MTLAMRFLMGAVAGGAVAYLGAWRGMLKRSGATTLGAIIAIIWAAAGWAWAVVVVVYWLGLAGLTPFRRAYKASLSERFESMRIGLDGLQVMARMAWAAFLAVWAMRSASQYLLAAFVGALAASAADAYSAQLGILSILPPRLITTWQVAHAGTAGAVSTMGLIAALGASWLVGLTALLAQAALAWQAEIMAPRVFLWFPLVAMIGGTLASLVDSLLGATAQGMYYCPICDQRTEYPVHTCGSPAEQIRGWGWLNNEGINLVCSLVGAALVAGLVRWLA